MYDRRRVQNPARVEKLRDTTFARAVPTSWVARPCLQYLANFHSPECKSHKRAEPNFYPVVPCHIYLRLFLHVYFLVSGTDTAGRSPSWSTAILGWVAGSSREAQASPGVPYSQFWTPACLVRRDAHSPWPALHIGTHQLSVVTFPRWQRLNDGNG